MKGRHEDMLDGHTWDQLGTQREDALVWDPHWEMRTRHNRLRAGLGKGEEGDGENGN